MSPDRVISGVPFRRLSTARYECVTSADVVQLTSGDGIWFARSSLGETRGPGPVTTLRAMVGGASDEYLEANPELLPAMPDSLYWGPAARDRARKEAADMRARIAAGCGYCAGCCSVVSSPGDWLCEACEIQEGE